MASKKRIRTLLFFTILMAVTWSAGIFGLLRAWAGGTSFQVDKITRTHDYLTEGYLDSYAVATEKIESYECNGSNWGPNVLARAFDRNFDTFWETNKINGANFTNTVTVGFTEAVEADRLVFATRRDDTGKGFPLTATFYVSENGTDFEKIGFGTVELCSNILVYRFDKAYTMRYFRFEYTDVNPSLEQRCSASEFIFFKPEEKCISQLNGMFADYTCTSLDSSYTKEQVRETIAQVKATQAYALRGELQYLVSRAEGILDGIVTADPAREFTTKPDEIGNATIARRGNISAYARNTLKMVWQGTNRQITGVCAVPGETLAVFVEAKEQDPLPTLVFTQHIGYWSKWKSSEYSLNRGLNLITVPDLYDSSWSVKTNPGGPIYLCNPYTEKQQSENVKIYMDGGYTIPVYRKGDDAEEYRNALAEYLELYAAEDGYYNDVTEMQSDRVILTVTASRAKSCYIDESADPGQALEGWDSYLKSLYEFDGVSYDPDSEHYDARAEYLNVNVRVMQPWAAAYAYTEHVGIQKGTWEQISCYGSGFGWGMSHELGHMMDISERTRSEVTNNMWSQFNKTALDGEIARGNFTEYLKAAAPDDNAGNAYADKASDALPWWCIESRFPGYWGRLDNCFRYEDRKGLSDAELHVYFSSLAAGIDLSYYFDRIGFSWKAAFTGYENASDTFRAAMESAKESGRIVESELKLWYVDAQFYNYYTKYGDELKMYGEKDGTQILNVSKTDAGYALLLPDVKDFRHLGYEILRSDGAGGFKVIGFTYGRNYTDTAAPADGTPTYKVRAFDRALGCAAESAAVSAAEQGVVASVNGQGFTSLAQAFAAAQDGETVYLLESVYETGVTVTGNVTLKPQGKNVAVRRNLEQVMFRVNSGASLTISGEGQNTLTLDGMDIAQADSMIISQGTLELGAGVVLQNGVSTGNGGAVRVSGGTFRADGTVFSNNRAKNGGALACEVASANVTLTNTEFCANSATESGGAIVMSCRLNATDVVFNDNAAGANGGAVCNRSGGILNVYGCHFEGNTANAGGALWLDGLTSLTGNGAQATQIANNSAQSYGGGVYVASSNSGRRTTFLQVGFSENAAQQGSCVYVNGYATFGGTDAVIKAAGSRADRGGTVYLSAQSNAVFSGGTWDWSGSAAFAAGKAPVFTALPSDGSSFALTFYVPADWDTSTPLLRFPTGTNVSDICRELYVYIGEDLFACTYGESDAAVMVGQEKFYGLSIRDGDEENIQYLKPGAEAVLPQAQGKDGYRFMGWQCGDALLAAGDKVILQSDMLAEAVYEKLYVIRFDTLSETFEGIAGEEIVLPSAAEKEGWKFVGWKSGEVLYAAGDKLVISGDLTLQAVYEELPPDVDTQPVPDTDDGKGNGGVPGWVWGVVAVAAVGAAAAVTAAVLLKKRNK